MNIYIFGTDQYASDIFEKLEKKDIPIYLSGEIKIIKEAEELLDAIKSKNDEDLFLIDDDVISKKNRKKSIFSFFSKQKFMIDEKEIEELAKSTIEANSLEDAITKILEEIDTQSLNELEEQGEFQEEQLNIDTDDNLSELDNIDLSNLDEELFTENKETSEEINDIKISEEDIKVEDDFSELSNLNILDLEDAFKDFKIEEIIQIDEKVVINTLKDGDQIKNITEAFTQLLAHNKKIKITLEISD